MTTNEILFLKYISKIFKNKNKINKMLFAYYQFFIKSKRIKKKKKKKK